jgi:hypothetical protein
MIPAYSSMFSNSQKPVGLEILIPPIEYSHIWDRYEPTSIIAMAIYALNKQNIPANSSSIHQYLRGSLSMSDIVQSLDAIEDWTAYSWGKRNGVSTRDYTLSPVWRGLTEKHLEEVKFRDKHLVPK